MKEEFKENGLDCSESHIIKMFLLGFFCCCCCFNESYTLVNIIPKIHLSLISPSLSSDFGCIGLCSKRTVVKLYFLQHLGLLNLTQFSIHLLSPFHEEILLQRLSKQDMAPDLRKFTIFRAVLTIQ